MAPPVYRLRPMSRAAASLRAGLLARGGARAGAGQDGGAEEVDLMPYIFPSIPTSPPQRLYCETCGKPCKDAPLCRRCAARQDTHRRRDDPWARVLR